MDMLVHPHARMARGSLHFMIILIIAIIIYYIATINFIIAVVMFIMITIHVIMRRSYNFNFDCKESIYIIIFNIV